MCPASAEVIILISSVYFGEGARMMYRDPSFRWKRWQMAALRRPTSRCAGRSYLQKMTKTLGFQL